MNNRDHHHGVSEIRYLKALLQTTSIPDTDFSEKVMDQLEQLEDTRTFKFPIKTFKRSVAAVCIIGLMSGFSYATSEWLKLRDKKGNEVMEVRKTDWEIPIEHTKVAEEVRKKIAPGEAATIYFGSKEDIIQHREKSIMGTTSPKEYHDLNQFINELTGPLKNSRVPIYAPKGYKFKAAYMYMDPQQNEKNEGPLIYDKTADGQEYAYNTRKTGSQVMSIILTYQKDEQEINYNVRYSEANAKVQFFDRNPSQDALIKINGIETYYYKDSLMWVEKGDLFSMNYNISSSTATKEQLIEFAEMTMSEK